MPDKNIGTLANILGVTEDRIINISYKSHVNFDAGQYSSITSMEQLETLWAITKDPTKGRQILLRQIQICEEVWRIGIICRRAKEWGYDDIETTAIEKSYRLYFAKKGGETDEQAGNRLQPDV